jgi:hypothetical protein
MINKIIEAIKDRIFTDEHYRKIEEVCIKYKLNDNQIAHIDAVVSSLLLGTIEEVKFPIEIAKRAEINIDVAKQIAGDLNYRVVKPFHNALLNDISEIKKVENKQTEVSPPIPHINQQPPSSKPKITSDLQSTTPVSPFKGATKSYTTKQAILNEIENPPRTTIKRYVVEYDHEPMKDTSHLITNKRDEILKLQDHYND